MLAVIFGAPESAPHGAWAAVWAGLCLAGYLGFAAVLTVIDAREHRLPRRWVWAMAAVMIPVSTTASALAREQPWGAAVLPAATGGIFGAAAWGLVFLAARLLSPGSMGLGDVRLAPVLGWILGTASLGHALAGLMAAYLLAGLWAGALILTGRAGRSSRIAFGPWMLAGAGLALAALPAG